MTSTSVVPARRSRFWLYLPFVLLVGFAAVWTGLWFYGRMKIIEVMDSVIARAADQGREISCPDRTIAGFPFRMEVTCRNPSFAMSTSQGEVSGTLGAVIVNARALDPTAVIAVLQGPMSVETDAGKSTAQWTEARISGRASGFSLGSIDAVINGLTFDLANPDGSATPITGSVAKIEGHVRQKPETVADGRADYDGVARLEGITSPALPLIAKAPGLEVELQVTATRLPLQPGGKHSTIADDWRDAGGAVTIVLAKLLDGDISAEAKGTLKLDAERKPEGKLDLAFTNLDKVTEALGIEVPGMMKPLLKSGKAPINLGSGRASLGPIPLAFFKPLY
jgi:hypothetical protein